MASPVTASGIARARPLAAAVLLGGACAGVFFGGVRPAALKGRELAALRERLHAECGALRAEVEALGRERVALETDWFYNERLRRLASIASPWGR